MLDPFSLALFLFFSLLCMFSYDSLEFCILLVMFCHCFFEVFNRVSVILCSCFVLISVRTCSFFLSSFWDISVSVLFYVAVIFPATFVFSSGLLI